MLLADPRIDPIKQRNEGTTPFFMACQEGHKEVVLLLLGDPRTDPAKPENGGATPLPSLVFCPFVPFLNLK